MALLARTLTIVAVDTGYTLRQLLINAGAPNLTGDNARVRVAKVIIQLDGAETDNVYFVEAPGPITTTVGNVPDQYGLMLSTTAASVYSTFSEDHRQNTNTISLDEIVLAADAANTVVHAWIYSI